MTGLMNSETLTSLTSATLNSKDVANNSTNYVTAIVKNAGTADIATNYQITAARNATLGNTQNTVTLSTLTGVLNSDSVTATGSGNFDDKNVGSGKTITATYTLSGNDAANYSIGSATTTGSITAKALTISGLAGTNKEYDGTTTATINTSSIVKTGLVIGDTVTVSATGAFNDKNVGNSKTVTITSTYGGADVNNYTITDQTSTTANISAKALTIATSFTSTTKEYDGTTAVNITTSNLSGVVTGENVTASGSGSFDNKNVGSGKTIT
ncbi:MAG: filamentous hemagglutinin, partial [Acidimicrobiia bacterium]|nr:filamentous hemagglutinin [Acidimicrobiia bacterium]